MTGRPVDDRGAQTLLSPTAGNRRALACVEAAMKLVTATTRPARRLAFALSTATVALLIAGCGTPSHRAVTEESRTVAAGTVWGSQIVRGGASADNGPRGLPGRAQFLQGGRVVDEVTFGDTGRFSAVLAPGSYDVKVCTSNIRQQNPDGTFDDTCSARLHAVVHSGAATTLTPIVYTIP